MPTDLAEHVTRLMVNTNSCTASFTQHAGIAALQGDQTPVHDMVAAFRRRRDLIVSGPERTARRDLPGAARRVLRVPQRHARSGAPAPRSPRCSRTRRAWPTLGGSAFGEHGEGYLRLSYANSEANLSRALERMRPVLQRLMDAR